MQLNPLSLLSNYFYPSPAVPSYTELRSAAVLFEQTEKKLVAFTFSIRSILETLRDPPAKIQRLKELCQACEGYFDSITTDDKVGPDDIVGWGWDQHAGRAVDEEWTKLVLEAYDHWHDEREREKDFEFLSTDLKNAGVEECERAIKAVRGLMQAQAAEKVALESPTEVAEIA